MKIKKKIESEKIKRFENNVTRFFTEDTFNEKQLKSNVPKGYERIMKERILTPKETENLDSHGVLTRDCREKDFQPGKRSTVRAENGLYKGDAAGYRPIA